MIRLLSPMMAGLLCAGAAVAEPSVVVLRWREGAVYTVTTMPGRVTDIVLEPGEQLAGAGPVAAGDTVRWIIADAESEAGLAKRRHVLVKPTAAGLSTNLVIGTDRRSYYVELRSTASVYMARVAWRYPAGELVALKQDPAAVAAATAAPAPAPVASASGPGLETLNLAWRITGRAAWKPLRVYDDGRRVVVEFPARGEMPPLFERTTGARDLQLLDYRIVGRRMVVDRLFSQGELRLGEGRRQVRVRLERQVRP